MNQTGALRKLLAAFDAHEAMLVAYRTSGRTPGKAIDTITRVKTVLPQIRELIERLPDSDPHTETPTPDDVLTGIVRRFLDGWTPLPFATDEVRWCREGPTEDRPDLVRSWEPMTPAERATIDRVRVVRADTPHHKATP